MLNYTPDQMLEAVDEAGFVSVLTGMGAIPAVKLPMSKNFLDQDISVIDLSQRAWAGCMRNGISTIGQLVKKLREKNAFQDTKNMGKKSIAEVKLKLTMLAYNELTQEERLEFWRYFLANSVPLPASMLA